ncbi:hypothetical protein ACH9D2_18210 [Kocuria sp. M4R2S49]|uniref:hypothetical protein n=1 Tax=Kocuria rhizosphaericola TaxID=3376284 RepID=UPI0037ADD638
MPTTPSATSTSTDSASPDAEPVVGFDAAAVVQALSDEWAARALRDVRLILAVIGHNDVLTVRSEEAGNIRIILAIG